MSNIRTLSLIIFILCLVSTNATYTNTTSSATAVYSSNQMIDGTLGTLKIILPLFRNLILVGTIFNLCDVFLPFILFSESLLLLGFWPAHKHQLDDFLKLTLNSKLDIMGTVRQLISGDITASTPSIFANVGFTDNIFLNLSGEFILAIIFLVFTVVVKMVSSICQSEKARCFASRLRCRWNGFFIGILPRLATLSTLHLTSDGKESMITFVILAVLIIAFWIQLFIHLRWVVAKPSCIEDRSHKVGLLTRIQIRKNFKFDCLKWSNIYFPIMNYTRFLIYFLIIGANQLSTFLPYAGPILSQLIILMIEVSSPVYSSRRDRILYPLLNFLMMLAQICKLMFIQQQL